MGLICHLLNWGRHPPDPSSNWRGIPQTPSSNWGGIPQTPSSNWGGIPQTPSSMSRSGSWLAPRAAVRAAVHERLAADLGSAPATFQTFPAVHRQRPVEVPAFAVDIHIQAVEARP